MNTLDGYYGPNGCLYFDRILVYNVTTLNEAIVYVYLIIMSCILGIYIIWNLVKINYWSQISLINPNKL